MPKLTVPQIWPIVWPHIDWNAFVKTTNEIIGRSPTRELDAAKMPVGSVSSFLFALQSFQKSNRVHPLLKHLSITFLCDFDYKHLLISGTSLKITPSPEGMFVISGTFDLWYMEIIEKCDTYTNPQVRLFYNCIYLIFCQKLSLDIWDKCIRRTLDDGTFVLEPR